MKRVLPAFFWKSVIGFLIIIMLLPIAFVATNSFMSEREINKYVVKPTQSSGIGEGIFKKEDYADIRLIPEKVSLQQYYSLLIEKSFYLKFFWNSIKLLVPILLGHLTVSIISGFAFAKLNFLYRDKLFFIYIVVMLMPYQATLVPNFITANWLGINESYLGIILPAIFNPFGVFLMTQFIKYIPDNCIESARLEGASYFTILTKIIMPMCRNGIIALAILNTIDVWNMVEQPLVYLTDKAQYPLSIMLTYIDSADYDILFSSAVIYILPMVFIFLKGEKYFVEGIEFSQIH